MSAGYIVQRRAVASLQLARRHRMRARVLWTKWETLTIKPTREHALHLARKCAQTFGATSVVRVRHRGRTIWMGDWHGNVDEAPP